MSHDIDSDLVHKLAQLLEETGLSEIEYGVADWRIRVAKAAVTVTHADPVAASASPATETPAADRPGAVKSPVVGTVYVAADPQSPPFVSVGDRVIGGQTLLIVEAMKVMNPILAPRAGTVRQVMVENGQPVEYGEVLMVIE